MAQSSESFGERKERNWNYVWLLLANLKTYYEATPLKPLGNGNKAYYKYNHTLESRLNYTGTHEKASTSY